MDPDENIYYNKASSSGEYFYVMKNIKIAISTPDRAVIIPMEYNDENDEIVINELQVEPIPDKDEDISKDLAFFIVQKILTVLK